MPAKASVVAPETGHGEFNFMSTSDVAHELRMTVGGLRTHLNRSRDRRNSGQSLVTDAPVPDGFLGRSPLWKPETIMTWIAKREEYGLKPDPSGKPQRFEKRPPRESSVEK